MSITDRARAEAERLLTDERGWGVLARTAFELGAQWAASLPPTDEEVVAGARILNLAGWTCYGGAHEPGGYDDCEDCRRVALELSRKTLTAAREAQR